MLTGRNNGTQNEELWASSWAQEHNAPLCAREQKPSLHGTEGEESQRVRLSRRRPQRATHSPQSSAVISFVGLLQSHSQDTPGDEVLE